MRSAACALLALCALCAAALAFEAKGATEAAAVPASTPGSSVIPYQSEPASGEGTALRMGVAVLVCALAGGAVLYALSRGRSLSFKALPHRRLTIVESRSLGAKARLVVVRYDDQQLLLAQTEAGVSVLHQKPQQPEGDAA